MAGNPEILIIGQGLAGTVLHFTLHCRGVSARVLDCDVEGRSSAAAAGIINPITGPKYQKSWNYDNLLDIFVPFYSEMEGYLGRKVFYRMKMYRYLADLDQINRWTMHAVNEGRHPCYGEFRKEINEYPASQKNGVWAEILNAFRVDLSLMLPLYREKIKEQGLFISEPMDYDAIYFNGEKIKYKDVNYDYIIFCEGYKSVHNPYFSELPVVPTKGEALLIDRIVDTNFMAKNRDLMTYWDANHVWYGATLSNKFVGVEPEPGSEGVLVGHYQQDFNQLPESYKVISGIRPATRDRRPITGRHPRFRQLAILNGLGTKGTSLAPYVAKCLTDHLLDNKEIPGEISLARFVSE